MNSQPKQCPLLPKYNTEYESNFSNFNAAFKSTCRAVFDLYPYKTHGGLQLPSFDIILRNYHESPSSDNKRNRVVITKGWSDNYQLVRKTPLFRAGMQALII